MADKQGGKKNRKLGRNADVCKRYTAADMETRNRKRKMRKHMRNNPDDLQNAKRYEETFGKVIDLGLTSRGRDLLNKRMKRERKTAITANG